MQLRKSLAKNRQYIILLFQIGCYFLVVALANALLLGYPHLCFFRAMTGYPCPGCGLTHAAWALLVEFDLAASLSYHALFLPNLVTLVVICLPGAWHPVIYRLHAMKWWYILLIVANMAYYGYRLTFLEFGESYPMRYDSRNYIEKILK